VLQQAVQGEQFGFQELEATNGQRWPEYFQDADEKTQAEAVLGLYCGVVPGGVFVVTPCFDLDYREGP
jgi:hypothetical protein